MSRPNSERLRKILDTAYARFHSEYHRERDPVSLVHRYADPGDREVAGFFAALLSYGNVTTILQSVGRVLSAFGPRPKAALLELGFPETLRDFRHRFTTGEDLAVLAAWTRSALRQHGTLEALFTASGEIEMKLRLSAFVRGLKGQPLGTLAGVAERRSRTLKYLLSDPLQGSACKRLNMFLRWMVRSEDGVDLGLWKKVPPSALMLPLDTHLLQTIRLLRWTRSRQATWKVVELATRKLRLYSPEDPIKYDFALCHLSMTTTDLKRTWKELDAEVE